MAEELEKTMSIDNEADDDAKSDIEEHEMEEVDKNGDAAAPPETSKPEEESDAEKKNRACRQGVCKRFRSILMNSL